MLSGNFVIEPPFGPNRAFFNKGGVFAAILDGYSISGNFTFATGAYASPQISGTAAENQVGANFLRPNRDFAQPIKGAGSRLSWFNSAAFVGACPAANLPQPAFCELQEPMAPPRVTPFSCQGPSPSADSLSRTITFGDTRSFEARINASNALNTVQYSGVSTQLNSLTYGQVLGHPPEVVHLLGVLPVLRPVVSYKFHVIRSGH